MKQDVKFGSTGRNRRGGFSVVELVVSLAVILILAAVAVPMTMRAVRVYQLNNAASQLAGILKLTRFEAIRRNTLISCQIAQNSDGWVLWVDSDKDGVMDPTEKQALVSGAEGLLPAGSVPSSATITASLGAASPALTVPYTGTGLVTYDARGAVSFTGGVPAVYVLYLGDASDQNAGFRAVVVLPSGVTQVWTASSGGNWQRVS